MIDKRWLGSLLVKDTALDFEPADIHTDSRTIKHPQVFLPLKGENFDGHNFIIDALNNGAKRFFYEPEAIKKIDNNLLSNGICVTDTYEALKAIATGFRVDCITSKVVALTGSVGKTTTKEMLTNITEASGKTLSAKGSFNNEIGVPLTILKWKKDDKYVVLEFGARHKGDISFLCQIAKPDVAACINVSMSHIGEFGSLDNIVQTKTEIFRDSPQQCTLVTSADNTKLFELAKETQKEVITFSYNEQSDVKIGEVSKNKTHGMNINLNIYGKDVLVTLPSYHDAYPINVAAATAIAKALNIPNEVIVNGLLKFEPVSGRFQTINTASYVIIDDSYNASPDSVKLGLKSFINLFPKQRKIVILGSMLELGPVSEDEHKKIGEFCASEISPDLLITVGDLAKFMSDGAVNYNYPHHKTLHFESSEDLISNIDKSLLPKSSVIYVKGSNGMHLKKVITFLQSIDCN